MQPLAEATRRKHRADEQQDHRASALPVTRAASKSGEQVKPRYSHGSRPAQTYQVSAAAISSVIMPAMVP